MFLLAVAGSAGQTAVGGKTVVHLVCQSLAALFNENLLNQQQRRAFGTFQRRGNGACSADRTDRNLCIEGEGVHFGECQIRPDRVANLLFD